MKIKQIVVMVLVSFIGYSVMAQPNTNTLNLTNDIPLTQTIKTAVQTNYNQVIIEMLSGTKDAAKEIYGASKDAIHKSIDFIGEQAPEVIKEFLTWKMIESSIDIFISFMVAAVLFFISYKLRKYQPYATTCSYDISEHNFVTLGKWVFLLAGFAVVIIGTGVNLSTIAKIKVAPKVYLIEYVVDQVKNVDRQHH